MLSRIISLHSRTHLRLLSRTLSPPSSSSPPLFSQIPKSQFFPNHHHFSTNNNNNDGNGEKPTSDIWNIGQENDNLDEIFGTHVEEMSNGGGNEGRGERKAGNFAGEAPWAMGDSRGGGRGGGLFEDLSSGGGNEGRGSRKAAGFSGEAPWAMGESGGGGVFKEFEGLSSGGGNEGRGSRNAGGFEAPWAMGESGGGGGGGGGVFDEVEMGGSGDRRELRREMGGEVEFQQWRIGEEEGRAEDVLGIGGEVGVSGSGDIVEDERSREEREMIAAAEKLQLEKEEQLLLEVVKGPDRAFGDLVAASGITDAMLDSLIALKNFQDIDGLPPLAQIEDERYAKTTRKSSRYEMELQKQEDIANARVRKVDEKGRAYGTGKRKCSIARVWIEPGEGKFAINDKAFDVYFPMLDHRAALLRPFSETKTLGLWDIKCTVKGGGTTGQVDAIRLGISRALQNWEPGLRAPLRDAGFLTRDPRIVERKKPGKAKARKSFQWVKR